MVDWRTHYDAIYDALSAAATLISPTSVGQIEITVIDKTAGVSVSDDFSVRSLQVVHTVEPAVAVRAYELADKGFSIDDIDGASITFNGRTWRVRNHRPAPSPAGEGDGEYYLFLSDA